MMKNCSAAGLKLTIALVLLASAGVPSARAANLYWDGGTNDIVTAGDGASAGGGGIWSTSISNWDPGATSNHIAWPAVANANVAILGGVGGTVAFATNLGAGGSYPNSITISAGNYVFDQNGFDLSWRGAGLAVSSGATLVLTNGTITDASGGVALSGANALKIYSRISGVWGGKGNAGDLLLYNDANDFTNALYGQNGFGVYFTSIKDAGMASAAGAGSVLQTGFNNTMIYIGPGDSANRTFSVVGGGNDAFNGSGTGALIWTGPFDNTKSGSSTLTFNGSNTNNNEFRGNLTNSAAGALSVNKDNGGTWILSGTNTYSGATTINAGRLILSGSLSGSAVSVTAAGTLVQNIGGVIAGTNGLANSGTTTLAGTNTYTGPTSISAGTLTLNGMLTNTAITVASGATFTQSSTGIIAGAASLSNNGTTVLSGANTYTGLTTISAGTVRILHGSALGDTSTGTFQSGTSALEIDGTAGAVNVGAEPLTINGTGISNLGALRNAAGTNSFGGTITLAAQSRINCASGTLTLTHTNAVTGAGQTAVFGGSGNIVVPGAITTLNVNKDGNGTMTLSGTNAYPGTTTVSAGLLVMTDGLFTNMNQVVLNATASRLVITNGARLFTSNGFVIGSTSGTIAMYSNTVWNMRGANSNPGNLYQGNSNLLLITDGAIVTNTFASGNALLIGGSYNTLQIENGGKVYWQIGGILFGQGAVRENRIFIGGLGTPAYMSSAAGAVQIPQNGSTIANHGITVSNGLWSAGNVYLGRSASTGNYINVHEGGIVDLNSSSLLIADSGAGVSNVLNVAGGLVTNVGQISVSSNNSVILNGGTIAAGANGALLNGTGSAYVRARGATFDTLAFSVTNTIALLEDPASTGGGLVKDGTGKLALPNACTFSGQTTINAGTLALEISGSLASTSILVETGAMLDVAARTDGTLTLAANQRLAGGGTVGGNVTNSGTIAPGKSIGQLNISGEFVQTGGTLNLELASGSNDTLSAGGSVTLGGTLNVTLANGYTPAPSDAFLILVSSVSVSGDFAATNYPALPNGEGWLLQNFGTALLLSVTGAPSSATGYDAWAGQITNGLTNYNDSATGDGYPNLLKYATGSSPTNSDTLASMGASREGGILSLIFNRNTNATDVTLIVEGANSATNDAVWTGIATNIAGAWSPTNGVTETGSGTPVGVSVQDNATNATNRFLRLRVTKP